MFTCLVHMYSDLRVEGNLPSFVAIRRAKRDGKVGGVRTCEGADISVVGVAISAWARLVKSVRVDCPLAFFRWYGLIDVESDTALIRQLVFLTCGPASDWIVRSGAVHHQLRWTRLVHINIASNALALFVRRGHKQRKVVTIDNADVIIV